MKMSDFFNLPMDVGSSNDVGTACTELADKDFYLADFHRENTIEEAHLMAKAAAYAIDHHDPLVAMNAELVEALIEIDDYLSTDIETTIGNDSAIHRKIQCKLTKAKELNQ
jgi:hypothetical protein